MTPGDVSDLSASGEVAFRARFFDRHAAARAALLARPGAARVRRPQLAAAAARRRFRSSRSRSADAPIRYQITLEPHARRWVLALDLPSRMAANARASQSLRPDAAVGAPDQQRRGLSICVSHPDFAAGAVAAGVAAPQGPRVAARRTNARSVALGRELAARHAGDRRARSCASCCACSASSPSTTRCSRRGSPTTRSTNSCSTTRKGFCEHYASAFTVVMRAAGMPARVVTGYQGGEFNPFGGYLIVRQSDAHAWSEVWIDGPRLGARRPDCRGRARAHRARPDRRGRGRRTGAGPPARVERDLAAGRAGLGRSQRFLEPARRALRRATRSSTCSSGSASTIPTGARSASGWPRASPHSSSRCRPISPGAYRTPAAGLARPTARRRCATPAPARPRAGAAPKARWRSSSGPNGPAPTSPRTLRRHPRLVCRAALRTRAPARRPAAPQARS